MFDFVRKHNRLMQFILLLLVFPAFVAIGFYGYSQGDTASAVATVGGDSITQQQWDQEVQRRGQLMRQRNPAFDISQLEEPQQKYRVLQDLVRKQVLYTALDKMHLRASDTQVAQALAQDPNIAALRKPDGQIDMQQYQSLLAASGLTPAQYEEQIRRDISVQQLPMNVFDSTLTVASLRDALLQAALQSRQVQLARFASADYLAQAQTQLSDAQLQQYYQAHQDTFKTPETVDIQYVLLTPEAVTAQLSFTDEQLHNYYQQNQTRFAGNEERRVSHILIKADASASAADKAKAKAKAEAVLAEVQANPTHFAAIAQKESQDAGSAAQGGDLGYITRGATANPAFDDAVFALKPGQISAVVESNAGYHIIKLVDVRGNTKTFEQAKPEIVASLKAEQGAKKYAELSEKFRDAVEDKDDLAAIAKQFNLPLQTATALTRSASAANASNPVLSNPKFLGAIFSAEALGKKHNISAVDVGAGQWASAHVLQHQNASVQAFAQVKGQVQALALAKHAQALAVAAGQAKLSAWKAGATATLDAPLSISRQDTHNLSPELVQAILKADANKLPAWMGFALPNHAGYVVAKIEKIEAPTDSKQNDALRLQLNQMLQPTLSNAEATAFIDSLRDQYKTKIKVAAPQAAASAAAPSPATPD